MMRGYLRILTLKALKEGTKTGYGLIKYIEEETGHKPSFGSIYPLLEHLLTEKLVTCKEKDNKKFYSLTKEGIEQLKSLANKKEEMIEKLQEVTKIFTMIHGQKLGPYQKKMMEKMKTDSMNLGDMPLEILRIKEISAKLMIEGKMKTHRKEINKILKKANDELKKL